MESLFCYGQKMEGSDNYYSEYAAAFVRGARPDLVADSTQDTILLAVKSGCRLHRFKRSVVLPRVQRTIGVLRGFQPETLLDVGTGRGTFLWPLLDQLETVRVTCIDVLQYRVDEINLVNRGGVSRLNAIHGDIQNAKLQPDSFDVVTMLEVLEHLHAPTSRLKTRFVLRGELYL